MELCNFKVNSLFNVSVFSDNRFNSELPFHGVSPQDTLIDSSKKDIFLGVGLVSKSRLQLEPMVTCYLLFSLETSCVTAGVTLWTGYILIRYEKEQYQECQYKELSVSLIFNPPSAILSS